MSIKHSIACDTLPFVGYSFYEDPKEILTAIKKAGYDGADPGWDAQKSNGKELRAIADSIGLDLPAVLGAWAFFHAGEDRDLCGDEAARQRGFAYARKAIDFAVELGARFFSVCAPQPPIYEMPYPNLSIQTLRRSLVEALREICTYAADRGITILFEPLNYYEARPGVLTSVYHAISLIEELGYENLGVQPDICHMYVSESSVTDALRAAGPLVKHVHTNETNRYSLGAGHADYLAIIRTLKEIDFDGYMSCYLPYTTQEIFNMASGGYAQRSGVSMDTSGRPDIMPYLEWPIQYLKEIERTVDMQREIAEVGKPY